MTQECSDFSEKISSYLDHELDSAEVEAMDQHLEQCETCSVLYEEFACITRGTIDAFHDIRVPDLLDTVNMIESVLYDTARVSRVVWRMTTTLTLLMTVCAATVIMSVTRFGWTFLRMLTKLATGVMNIGPWFGWWTLVLFFFSAVVFVAAVLGIRLVMRFPIEGQPRAS